MNGLISIIIPVYGVEKYIRRCLDSVLKQSYKNIEVIIVNDETKDNSMKIVADCVKNDKRCKIYSKKNSGLGLTRNYGINKAIGEYIVFLDSDDYITYDYCEKMIMTAKKYNADIVYSNHFIDNNGRINLINNIEKEIVWKNEEIKELLLNFIGTKPNCKKDTIMEISVWKALFKKEIFDNYNIRFVSERKIISEDLIFDIEFLSKCSTIVGIPNHLYAYCVNLQSLSKSYREDRFKKEKELFFATKKMLKKLKYQKSDIIERTDRLLLSRARVDMFQIFQANENKQIKEYKYLLDEIVDDKDMQEIFNRYNFMLYPKKYRLIAFLQKSKLYYLIKIIAKIKKRG